GRGCPRRGCPRRLRRPRRTGRPRSPPGRGAQWSPTPGCRGPRTGRVADPGGRGAWLSTGPWRCSCTGGRPRRGPGGGAGGPAGAGRGFRVLAVALRGHGASLRTVAGLSLSDLADDVAETVGDEPVEL